MRFHEYKREVAFKKHGENFKEHYVEEVFKRYDNKMKVSLNEYAFYFWELDAWVVMNEEELAEKARELHERERERVVH